MKLDNGSQFTLTSDSAALTRDNQFIYAHNSAGQVNRFTIEMPPYDARHAACERLAAGRSEFTGREMLEYSFLEAGDRNPCARVGPLSWKEWVNSERREPSGPAD